MRYKNITLIAYTVNDLIACFLHLMYLTNTDMSAEPAFYIGPNKKGYKTLYGIQWKEEIPLLQIHLACFREKMARRIPWKHGGYTPKWFFKAIAKAIWPEVAVEQGHPQFMWNSWADWMLEKACEENFLAIAGCAGLGKCLAPEVPVLCHDGTIKRANKVKKGDLLMGDDSLPRTVIGTRRGKSNMVKIIPKRGGLPWRCNDDHMLTLKRTFSGSKSSLGTGEIIDISVKDFLKKSKRFQQEHKLFCKGVEFPEQKIEIEPRAYGIWLGDGRTGGTGIESHDQEKEVDKYIQEYFTSCGYITKKRYYSKKNCGTWLISRNWAKNNPFRTLVKESSKGGKRIIKRFLQNSRANRLELLAGILDADGHSNGTAFEIFSSYDGLHDDIVFLARSLGFRVASKIKKVNCNGKECYTKKISIRGNVEEIPTLRKKCRSKKGSWKDASYTAFKIEQDGIGEWTGFQVDGNGRYLLGDFTVTHNSEFYAIWLIIQFLSDPANTLCMTTSMTLGASKMKMWSKIVQYWTPLEKMGMPGKLVDSIGRINYVDENGAQPMGGLAGIALIPADRKREKDALESLIGIHPKRAIFVADDLTGLSEAVTEACFSNLSMGCEYFQFVGLANPKSYRDSFGRFAKPVRGWESISVEDLEWKTERGVCIHFDATKNPRITEGDERLKWMLTQEQIDEKKRIDGEKSSSFWRMVRGFWSPEGTTEFIYTEAEIVNNQGDKQPVWKDDHIKLCFMDPSFTDGGARTIAYFGDYGKNLDGYDQFAFDEYVEFHEDVTIIKEIDRTRQLINWWKKVCFERGVLPKNAGMDSTGAGKVLLDDVRLFWSREVHGMNFGEVASERPVSVSDPTPANERYGNTATEIWYSCKEALRTGQIRGIGPDLMSEMTSRKKIESKDIKSKIFAQPKREMRLETGESPDIADAGLGCVELARRLYGFNTSKAANEKFREARTAKPFKESFEKIGAFKHTPIESPGQPFQMRFTKKKGNRFGFMNVRSDL